MNKFTRKSDTPTSFIVGVFFVFITQFLVAVGLTGCGTSALQRSGGAGLDVLVIKTADKEHQFEVELALDEREQAKGLMFRRSMANNHGMLFVYNSERQIGMWMKNTFLSLDMLFVKRDGTIVKIAKMTEPFSLAVISSEQPVFAVLELNAGVSDKLGLRVGDHLLHPLLQGK